MGIAQRAVFIGGRHDGEHAQPSDRTPYPETLFCITWDDGEAYARTAELATDGEGRQRVVFRHDPDGSLTAVARATFSDIASG